jgi:hypothetical protein
MRLTDWLLALPLIGLNKISLTKPSINHTFQIESHLGPLISDIDRYQLIFNSLKKSRFRPHQIKSPLSEEKIKATLPECFHKKQAASILSLLKQADRDVSEQGLE